ncbi:MAG: hypothetical protein ABSF34_03980 [Verrucomicrobiota bacterium]|jgi:hypothetical protein
MEIQTSNMSLTQRFEAWKQKQGRNRVVLFWSGLWAFVVVFCLATWYLLHTPTPPTKTEFFSMAVIGLGFLPVWPLIVFGRKNSTR